MKPTQGPTGAWLLKLTETTLALIAVTNSLMLAVVSLQAPSGQMAAGWLPGIVLFRHPLLLLLPGAALAWWWQRAESARPSLQKGHERLRAVIRYWLAFTIAEYGFSKLLGYQFQTANYTLDQPLGTVSGAALTWYYFGYAPAFGVLLGWMQVIGAGLLLFRRTTLLGALALLPMMVNIVLINLAYDIGPEPLLNSVLYTGGLLFLVTLHGRRLWAAVMGSVERVTAPGNYWRWLARAGVLGAAVGVMYLTKGHQSADTTLRGVWRIESLSRAGRRVPLDSVGTDPHGWTRCYFGQARRSRMAIRLHPNRYEPRRELRGDYRYAAGTLRALLRPAATDRSRMGPGDSLVATIRLAADQRHASVTGTFGRDPLELTMTRIR